MSMEPSLGIVRTAILALGVSAQNTEKISRCASQQTTFGNLLRESVKSMPPRMMLVSGEN